MELTVDSIIEEVSEVFNCEVAVIKSPMKMHRVIAAKQAAIFLIRKYKFEVPLRDIAQVMRYKTIHSVSRANNRAWTFYEVDGDFRKKVQLVERKLLSSRLKMEN